MELVQCASTTGSIRRRGFSRPMSYGNKYYSVLLNRFLTSLGYFYVMSDAIKIENEWSSAITF